MDIELLLCCIILLLTAVVVLLSIIIYRIYEGFRITFNHLKSIESAVYELENHLSNTENHPDYEDEPPV